MLFRWGAWGNRASTDSANDCHQHNAIWNPQSFSPGRKRIGPLLWGVMTPDGNAFRRDLDGDPELIIS